MRQVITVLSLVVSLSAVAFSTSAAQAKPAAKSSVGSHSTSGVIKSIDSSTMVITRPGKGGDMTFALNASTQRDGSVGVGSTVTVRYQTEGKSMVATAIAEQKPKQTAAAKPAAKK